MLQNNNEGQLNITVKPQNSDHIGNGTFGLFSEVGPFSEVLM